MNLHESVIRCIHAGDRNALSLACSRSKHGPIDFVAASDATASYLRQAGGKNARELMAALLSLLKEPFQEEAGVSSAVWDQQSSASPVACPTMGLADPKNGRDESFPTVARKQKLLCVCLCACRRRPSIGMCTHVVEARTRPAASSAFKLRLRACTHAVRLVGPMRPCSWCTVPPRGHADDAAATHGCSASTCW